MPDNGPRAYGVLRRGRARRRGRYRLAGLVSDEGVSGARRRGALSLFQKLKSQAQRRLDDTADGLLGAHARAQLQGIAYTHEPGGTDPFGFDPEVARYGVIVAQWLYRHWFRAEAKGVENVPDGPILLIANHSGQLPFDGMCIASALLLDRSPPRFVRSMVEKFTATLPFVSALFPRLGQIVGVPENCERLLALGEAILVFPEGSKGISKPFSARYRLTEFGLGFMRLALKTGTPIVPVAVVGAEEQYVNLADLGGLAKALGMPVFPVVPQWLLPGGVMPLPVKYHIAFGAPLRFTGDPDDEDAVIDEKVEVVKKTIQSMVNRGLKERRGIFR
ncbi:MAG: acyltransferase family protein [Myxococcales bacterium]|nr:acyltransferase family protein [Myxococcales bacterium]